MVNIYIARNSIIHNTHILIKCIVLSVLITLVHIYRQNIYVMCIILVFCICCYLFAKLSLIYLWKVVKVLFPFIVMIGIYNFFIGDWILAVQSSIQMIVSVGLANLLAITTPLHNLMEDHTRLSRFLVKCKVPVPLLRLMISIIFRTVPLLTQEIAEIHRASILRGRYRKNIGMLFPLLLRTVIETDTLVDALSLRGKMSP